MNSIQKKLASLCAVLSLVFLSGCLSTAPVQLLQSTIPLEPGSYTELGEVKGDARGVVILAFSTAEPLPTKVARDRALAQNPDADALINVAVDLLLINLGPVQIITVTVSGTAVKVNR